MRYLYVLVLSLDIDYTGEMKKFWGGVYVQELPLFTLSSFSL